MIESNIIKWIDLGESMQYLDVYGKSKWMKFFNLIKILISFKKFSIFFYIVLKSFYFLQIIMLNLTNLTDDNDTAIKILTYIAKVIFVQNIITDNSTYKIAVIFNGILTFISIISLIYIIISVRIEKFYAKIPITLFNFTNILLLNYFIGPIVQISILSTNCTNGIHVYLNVTCYSDYLHLVFLFISVINLIYFVILSVILSIYFNEIGSINENKVLARVNTNYEIYTNLFKIAMFIFAYFIKFLGSGNDIYRFILQILMMVFSIILAVYVYKSVLFYDTRINGMILYGWIFVAWFSTIIFLKSLVNINDTSIFHITGWVIISAMVYFLKEIKEEHLLTDFNIFEAKSLKDIELFNLKLFNLMNMRSIKNKTLLIGIIKKFEELVNSNYDMKEKYTKLYSNEHLKKKFNSNTAISVFSIVYLIYDYHLDKSALKNDILLTICYFLMNKLKNVTYAVYLCSKIKAVSHKQMYLKFLLMEEIKSYMINKLSKSNNKDSIKHVQLGSVILYDIYIDLFKFKILDSACFQVEYFDLLRNTTTNPNTTENFLKLGEDILNLRKEIMKLWEKIVELNPFNEDSHREYTLYLKDILQDEILLKNEFKKFNNIKSSKINERNNIYNSLFSMNSSIILVDGYSIFGKILYASQNFSGLYNFSGKEVLNMGIDDLCPGVIKDFHKEIIDNALKYSNLSVIFNKQKDFLLKGKSGNLHSVKIYTKCIPNLSYGLIYMVNIMKVLDNSYIIVLDKDFKISAFTDIFTQGANYIGNNGYSLDKNIINSYLGVVIPDILLQLDYREDYGFYLAKDDSDLKGVLYNVDPQRSFNEKVEKVLIQIKLNGKLNFDHEGYQDSTQEYDELIKEINLKSSSKHSIFYKVITRTFLNKYRYYRVYISNDLITMHEHSNTNDSGINSSTGNQQRNNSMNHKYKGKIKDDKDKTTNLKSENNNTKENKQNQTKLKLNPLISGEENNKLLEKEPDDTKKPDGKTIKNNINNIIAKEIDGFSLSDKSKSAHSKSSVDSASFNKLKNGILEKKEVSSIKFMRYLSFCFGLGTIILIFFSAQASNQKFSRLNDYMLQNLYFNHSKISVSCVYLHSLNLKLMKNLVYNDNRCYTPCTQFYSKMLKNCVTDIKFEKENSTNFFDDFKNILNSQKNISLNLFNFTEKDLIKIDVENNLNLIVSYGLKLNSNINEYYKNPSSVLDVISDNIIEQSLLFIYDEKITGFNNTQKTINLQNSYLNPINSILIVEAGLLSILIIFFVIFICRLNGLENFYLGKLIKFKNLPFEAYLKSLDDIKKKKRNDNGEDEEKFNNDVDLQEFGIDSKGSNNKKAETENVKEKSPKGKKKDKKKKKDEKDKKDKKSKPDQEKEVKKTNQRKNKNKKIGRNIQEEKISLMGNFFNNSNIFFCIKVILILLLSSTYYVLVSILDQTTMNNMLSFDSTTNSIEGVYKESFMIYLNLKTELAKYIDYEIEKEIALKKFSSNNNTSVIFKDQTFSNLNNLISSYYKMNLPYQLDTPKIGTLLMPIISTDLTSASTSIVSLNNLYNIDACAELFDPILQMIDYTQCSNFWSSILLKGMEQSITQMSVVITSVLDDLNSLNQNSKSLKQILLPGSVYNTYEQFVELYLFKSYMKTVEIFRNLNLANLNIIYSTYHSTMIGYICFIVILFGFLLYFVYISKFIFSTFLNFIGILPMRYLLEDQVMYKEILKLEQYIYY